MFTTRVAGVQNKRALSAPLPQSAAPYTSSELFKTPTSKPLARSWARRLSKRATRTEASVLKGAASNKSDNIITLGTGRPSPEFYPWTSLSTVGVGDIHEEMQQMREMSSTFSADPSFKLSVALNYGYAAGSPQLLRFITEHVEMIHDPPYRDWESALTCGSTSALDIIFQTLCNAGDQILTEKYTYTGMIQATKSQGLGCVGIEMDEQGLLPHDLDAQLRGWDETKGKKPFVLYMIPTGQNPTGTTQSRKRREAIYNLAEEHDLLIVEDDPYYFLQLSDSSGGILKGTKTTKKSSNNTSRISRHPIYLSTSPAA